MMPSWLALEERACVQPLGWPKRDSTPLVYPNSSLPEVTLSPLRAGSMLRLGSECLERAACRHLADVNLVCTRTTGNGTCTIR